MHRNCVDTNSCSMLEDWDIFRESNKAENTEALKKKECEMR
jgi:hypothetical protein